MALRQSPADSRESVIESRRSPVAIAESLSHRVVIEEIQPDIDGGRFPIKRTVGESVDVTATIFADGHDVLVAVLRDRHQQGLGIGDWGLEEPGTEPIPNPKSLIPSRSTECREAPMTIVAPGTDRWTARFDVASVGWHAYQIIAWIDRFLTGGRRAGRVGGVVGGIAPRSRYGESRPGSRRGVAAGAGRQADRLDTDRRSPAGRAERRAGVDDDGSCRSIARHRVGPAARVGRSGAGTNRRVVRDLPPLGRPRRQPERHAPRGVGGAAAHRRPRVRRRVSAADSSDRHELSQGAQQRAGRRPGRSGQPVGDRLGGRRPHGRGARPRHARGFRSVPRRGRAAGPRGRARSRLSMLAGSSVGARAPGMVSTSPRRHDQVRRKPSEEVPGHRAVRFRVRGLARAVAGAPRRHHVLGRARRADLPRRQPAHQDAPVLGMADRSRPRAGRRRHPAVGSVHAARAHALPRQVRLHAVVHLLHLEEQQGRSGPVLHRADHDGDARVFPAESLCQHARHPARVPAARRAAGLRGAPAARRHARRELRHLQRLRAGGGPGGPRHRGVRRLREVSAQEMGLGSAGAHQGADRARQHDSAAPSRAAGRSHPPVRRDRQPGDHRVHEDRARPNRNADDDRQPRSALHAARARADAPRLVALDRTGARDFA